MFEHWDVMIDGVKYEVKGRKKVNRWDKVETDDIHIEFLNVNGDPGWIDGKADSIVFEREKDFLLTNRAALADTIRPKVKNEFGKGFYQRHSRPGRKDLVTLVPLADVMKITHVILPKL